MDLTDVKTNHAQINEIIALYNAETNDYVKLSRAIDLSEVIIKTYSIFILATYFERNKVSKQLKKFLVFNISKPSLGIWKRLGQKIIYELMVPKELNKNEFSNTKQLIGDMNQIKKLEAAYQKRDNNYYLKSDISNRELKKLREYMAKTDYKYSYNFIVDDFYNHYKRWLKSAANLIEIRNKYAHGATTDSKINKKELANMKDDIKQMLESELLNQTAVIIKDLEDEIIDPVDFLKENNLQEPEQIKSDHPYLINQQGKAIELFPVLEYRSDFSKQKLEEKELNTRLFFYNKLTSSKKIDLLNYVSPPAIRKQNFYQDFISVIELEQWKEELETYIKDPFREKINSLLENFQERIEYETFIKDFILDTDKGFLFLYGAPGIGKSALMAKIFNDLYLNKFSSEKEENNFKEVKVLNYFIERSSNDAYHLLKSLNQRLEGIYRDITETNSSITLSSKNKELENQLKQRLTRLSRSLEEEKVVIFIDGLDEASQEILARLIQGEYDGILIIYSSRKNSKTDRFRDQISEAYIKEREINPMNEAEIRELLANAVNKYEIEREFLKAVVNRAEGNLIYLKYLVEDLKVGELRLNDIKSLPRNLKEYYRRIIARLSRSKQGKQLLDSLSLLAVAKDYLSLKQLRLSLGIKDSSKGIALIKELQEILKRKTISLADKEIEVYQIYHETFRDYILSRSDLDLREMEEKLIDLASHWQDSKYQELNYDLLSKRYAMKYLAEHLFVLAIKGEQSKAEKLWELLNNKQYREQQIDLLGSYNYSVRALNKGIDYYTYHHRNDYRLSYLLAQRNNLKSFARNDIEMIFKAFKEEKRDDLQRIRRALKKIKVLAEKDSLLVIVYLIQLELERWQGLEAGLEYINLLIDTLDSKSSKNKEYEWSNKPVTAYVILELIDNYPDLDFNWSLKHLSKTRFDLLNHIIYLLQEDLFEFDRVKMEYFLRLLSESISFANIKIENKTIISRAVSLVLKQANKYLTNEKYLKLIIKIMKNSLEYFDLNLWLEFLAKINKLDYVKDELLESTSFNSMQLLISIVDFLQAEGNLEEALQILEVFENSKKWIVFILFREDILSLKTTSIKKKVELLRELDREVDITKTTIQLIENLKNSNQKLIKKDIKTSLDELSKLLFDLEQEELAEELGAESQKFFSDTRLNKSKDSIRAESDKQLKNIFADYKYLRSLDSEFRIDKISKKAEQDIKRESGKLELAVIDDYALLLLAEELGAREKYGIAKKVISKIKKLTCKVDAFLKLDKDFTEQAQRLIINQIITLKKESFRDLIDQNQTKIRLILSFINSKLKKENKEKIDYKVLLIETRLKLAADYLKEDKLSLAQKIYKQAKELMLEFNYTRKILLEDQLLILAINLDLVQGNSIEIEQLEKKFNTKEYLAKFHSLLTEDEYLEQAISYSLFNNFDFFYENILEVVIEKKRNNRLELAKLIKLINLGYLTSQSEYNSRNVWLRIIDLLSKVGKEEMICEQLDISKLKFSELDKIYFNYKLNQVKEIRQILNTKSWSQKSNFLASGINLLIANSIKQGNDSYIKIIEELQDFKLDFLVEVQEN